MKLTKKRLMENAGLLQEKAPSQYAIMVGSHAARLVGFEVSISSGKAMDGGTVSGDFLVVGYGSIVQNTTGDFTYDTRPSNGIIFVQQAWTGGSGKVQGVLYHPSMDGNSIKVKQ